MSWTYQDAPGMCCCGGGGDCPCQGRCFNGSSPYGSYSQYIVEVIQGRWPGGILDTAQPFTILETLTLTRGENCRYSDAISTPYGRFFVNGPANTPQINPCGPLVNVLYLFSTYLPGDNPLRVLGLIARSYDGGAPTEPSSFYQQLLELTGPAPSDGIGIRHFWGGSLEQCCADGCNAPLVGPVTLTVQDLAGAPSYPPIVLPKNPANPDPSVPPPGWGDEVGFYFAINEQLNSATGWRLRLWRAPGGGTPVYTVDSTYAETNGWSPESNVRLVWRECSPFRAGGPVRLRDPDGIVRDRVVIVESAESPGVTQCEGTT